MAVKRARKDVYGDAVTDDEGNIIYDDVPLLKVRTLDGDPLFDTDGKLITEEVMTINFGYRTSSLNTSRRGDVVEATFKVDTPLFITPLYAGDKIFLQDYDRSYVGDVVKKSSFALGSIIWFDEVEN